MGIEVITPGWKEIRVIPKVPGSWTYYSCRIYLSYLFSFNIYRNISIFSNDFNDLKGGYRILSLAANTIKDEKFPGLMEETIALDGTT